MSKRFDYVAELYRAHCDHDVQRVERASRKVLRKLVRAAVLMASPYSWNAEMTQMEANRIARELVPGKRAAK